MSRGLCRQCYADRRIRASCPLLDGERRPRWGHNPGEQASDPEYLDEGLTLNEKVAAVFLYWLAWREDYEVERVLRADLTAVFLREYKVAERATVAVRLAVEARR